MKDYHLNSLQTTKPTRFTRKRKIIAAATLVLGLLAVAGWWFFVRSAETPTQTEVTESPTVERAEEQVETAPELPNLQPVVDRWVQSNNGTASIVITDTTGKQLASHNPAQVYFAASIYKLYVAYSGYQKIDDGTHSLNEPYLSGYTRGECLDLMIRDSNSPCGEKLWAELGKANLTNQMKNYGLKNTDLTGLQTTAQDAAIILRNIANSTDLKPESQKKYLDSMKTQESLYRRGLPSGFKSLTVYNKVGWNLNQEWHDTAIVQTKDGQNVIVSVFTNGVGYRSIASLGTELEKALQ